MYCPTCGVRLAEALSYCNRCGASLSMLKLPGEAQTTGKTIDTLVWVIVGTTITFLGMGLGALVLMKDGTVDPRLGTVFVILSFVALVMVEAILVWRLLSLNRAARGAGLHAQSRDLTTEELVESPARALHEPAESVRSASEQITRAFEPSSGEGERPQDA